MTIYNDVFGGANIYPSDISYSFYDLTADVALSWPEETSASGDLATRIIDVSTLLDDLVMTLPVATGTGGGQTVMFNNVGSKAVIISDFGGTQVVSLAAGTVWQVYLSDNSTAAGTWVALQYGASATAANASALAGTGLIAIGTLLSQAVPITSLAANYTSGNNDRAKMFLWVGAAGSLTLPNATSVQNNWFILFRNAGTGAVTVSASGGADIDNGASLSYQPGESSIIACDGTNYYTIGFGQSAEFVFDYTSIDIAGLTTYTLTGSELNRIVYNFTGALTADCTIIVPATVQQYWITNGTTGLFDIIVKTAAGLGVTLVQDSRIIAYCDGVDVLAADTSGISIPLAIDQGGTAAVTVEQARVSLGGTSVGIAIFTAADANAVWSTLGNSPLIDGGTF